MIGASARNVTRWGPSDTQAELEGEDEPVAPLASRHLGRLLRERLGQFVIQGEDDGPLVWKVAIQERGTHAGPGRHLAQRGRLIATLANQADGRLVETETGGLSFGRPTWRAASFS